MGYDMREFDVYVLVCAFKGLSALTFRTFPEAEDVEGKLAKQHNLRKQGVVWIDDQGNTRMRLTQQVVR